MPCQTPTITNTRSVSSKLNIEELALNHVKVYEEATSILGRAELEPGDTVAILKSNNKPFEHWKIVTIGQKHRCKNGKLLDMSILSRGNKRICMCFLDTRRCYYPLKNPYIGTWWVPFNDESEQIQCVESEVITESIEQQLLKGEEDEYEECNEEKRIQCDGEIVMYLKCSKCLNIQNEIWYDQDMRGKSYGERICLSCTERNKRVWSPASNKSPDGQRKRRKSHSKVCDGEIKT